jgi:transposase
MSEKQWKRWEAVKRVAAGQLTTAEAGEALGLSKRQVRRLRRAVEARGKLGVVHGNAGRVHVRRLSEAMRKRVVSLMREKYSGFNDTHFAEKLRDTEGIVLARSTVRRLLRAAGIGAARKRRSPRHRRRRDRKAREGLMLLWDGSRHDWLEGRGPRLSLVGAIDDATGKFMPGAHFVEQECSAGYLRVLREICKEKGLPWSIYMDRHGSLQRNDGFWTLEEELAGKQHPTQVGQALDELGIERIYALSPQAKGRVERLWGTLQDRLCSELRLAGAADAEVANRVLREFVPEFNTRFSVVAAERSSAWRTLRIDVDKACAFRYEATVGNDNAARVSNVVVDIPPGPGGRSYAKARVDVRQFLDGSWRVYFKDQVIATKQITGLAEPRHHRRHRRSATEQAFARAITRLGAIKPTPKPSPNRNPALRRSMPMSYKDFAFGR